MPTITVNYERDEADVRRIAVDSDHPLESPYRQHDGGTQVRFHYGTPGTIAEGARVDAKGYGPWAGYGGTFT